MRKYVHLRQSAFNGTKCTLHKDICIVVNIERRLALLIVSLFYWIYCSVKRMSDHTKDYSFDVIEFTRRANESCLTNLNFARR